MTLMDERPAMSTMMAAATSQNNALHNKDYQDLAKCVCSDPMVTRKQAHMFVGLDNHFGIAHISELPQSVKFLVGPQLAPGKDPAPALPTRFHHVRRVNVLKPLDFSCSHKVNSYR